MASENKGWTNVDVADSDCPLVRSVNVAQEALDRLHESREITGEGYAERCAILAMRRQIIAASQREWGCPRRKTPDEEAEVDWNKSAAYNCALPTGREEMFATGDNGAQQSLVPHRPGGTTGFVS